MEKIYYCPTEKEERTFKRVDKGISVVGRYQCTECGDTYGEATLHEDGLVGAIRDNIKLTNMNLPPRGTPFHYCKKCKEWVPFEDKHNRKLHK